MDTVFIEKLEIVTTIGVYDWERSIKQCLLIDLTIAWDNNLSAQNDDIYMALDYVKITEKVNEFAENSSFKLIESFAEQLANLLQHSFKLSWLRLKVTKPGAIASAEGVGVQIERGSF